MINKSFNKIIEKNGNKYFCFIRKRKNVNEYKFSIKINDLSGCVMIAGFCGGRANNSPAQVNRGFPVIENKAQVLEYLKAIL